MSDFGFYGKTISVFEPTAEEDVSENFGKVGEVKTETQFEKDIKDKINILILNPKNENFDFEEVGKVEVCGKCSLDYVVNACIVQPKVIACEFVHNVLDVIRPYLNNLEYTLVLYADTPLLKKVTILEILEQVFYKGLNVCKFARGYCFKTEYIKRVSEVYSAEIYSFEDEDFVSILDIASLTQVREIMKNRICAFHIVNGVDLLSPDQTYIESDVTIGRGTVVDANVRLIGKTRIERNCKIGYGCDIENSKIEEKCDLVDVTIINSLIGEECVIGKGTYIVSSKLDEECEIGNNVYIENSQLDEEVSVLACSHIFCANIGEDCKIDENVLISKNEGFRTKIFGDVNIGSGAKIYGGVTIGEKVEIPAFELVKANINTKA